MLTISGFPAWENNEQEENKNVPGLCCLKIEQKKGFLLQKYSFYNQNYKQFWKVH